MRRKVQQAGVVLTLLLWSVGLAAQSVNRPERLEWFQDQGLGLFIHWSIDSQVGSVISHSMVGASEEYVERFINELPKTFKPTRFDPDEWARLAKLAGFKYVVFTTKHHSGFCMFETETHDFDIVNTPYGQDITRAVTDAFRAYGIAPGFYFSPDDFYILYKQETLISRRRPEALPRNNPELMAVNTAQLRELFNNYGPIDVLFIDGAPDGLTDIAWAEQPNTVITRGAMETPEIAPSTGQALPDLSNIEPWEACFTMGTSWQFKPTNETYLSGGEIILRLIETRAKGGNMLMNVGPTPEGEIPSEQVDRLRELGLWLMVNGEAIYGVRPWKVTNEGDVWFTKKKDEPTVYAFVTKTDWPHGTNKGIELKSVTLTEDSRVSVLGQNDEVLEYQTDVRPKTTWAVSDSGILRVTAMRSQRLYNDRTWSNPVVLKITRVKE